MKEIGGYFELELRQGEHYHKNALLLNTARNCFEYIILARNYTKVYIPYYTCDVMLQALCKHNIAYEFYSLNETLEPEMIRHLLPNEAFLYTNYFGLKQYCVERLAAFYGSQLIVDNAQAFYAPRINFIDTFYSPRKFFGVPDGGYLYTDCLLQYSLPQDKSYLRMQHLLQRIDEGAECGYTFFRKNEAALNNNPILKMSNLTQSILCNIDYEDIAKKRRENFLFLHKYLKNSNYFKIDLQQDEIPMSYPYYTQTRKMRERLIKCKIFIPIYWINVLEWCNSSTTDSHLVHSILPLPIDQRYTKRELKEIIDIILWNDNEK